MTAGRSRAIVAGGAIVLVVAALAVAVRLIGRDDTGSAGGPPSSASPTQRLVAQPLTAAALATARAHACPVQDPDPTGPDAFRAASLTRLEAFRPIAAVRCEWAERRYADGEWSVIELQVSTSSVAAFVRALDHRNQSPGDGACAAYADLPPQLVLVDASGHVLRPSFPLDDCGHIQQKVKTTMSQLTWRTLSTHKLLLQVPNDPVTRTCERSWKDVIQIESSSPDLRHGSGLITAGGASIACVYRVGSDPMVGNYVRGLSLDAARTDELATALADAAPDGSCAPQREFAVLHDGSHLTYVELGGCWRVLRDDGKLGGADATTVRRVLGL